MKRDLSHIKRVDIELHSFCNRKCEWCPNQTLLRNKKEILSDEVFTSILKQLRDNNFGEKELPFNNEKGFSDQFISNAPVVSFLGYMEPFSDIDLLKRRVKEANDYLHGRTSFIVHTNGDYLTKESLDGLMVTSLFIEDYDCKGKEYWLKRLEELDVLVINYNETFDYIHCIHRYIGSVTVALNWSKHIELENRGGYFKPGDLLQYKWANNMDYRTIPCPEPDYYINISYDGSVMPCCHMRPDNPDHKAFILGNVKDTSLMDIYYSDKADALRKQLRIENGNYPEPCKRCQKLRVDNCLGSPSGWNYFGLSYCDPGRKRFENK